MKKLNTKGLGVISALKLADDEKFTAGLSKRDIYNLHYQAGISQYKRTNNTEMNFIRAYLIPFCITHDFDLNITKLLKIKRDKTLGITLENYLEVMIEIRTFFNEYIPLKIFCIENNYKLGFVKRAISCSKSEIRVRKVIGSIRYHRNDLNKFCDLYLGKVRSDPNIGK